MEGFDVVVIKFDQTIGCFQHELDELVLGVVLAGLLPLLKCCFEARIETLDENEDLKCLATKLAVIRGPVVQHFDDKLVGEVLLFHFGQSASVLDLLETGFKV